MIPSEINHRKQWKYANPEVERRFLVSPQPEFLESLEYKEITDKYLNHTNLRLRHIRHASFNQYKLTKKLPIVHDDKLIQWVSTIYLNEEEHKIFNGLAGCEISKRRYHLPLESGKEVGIDEIELIDRKLWIAEIEFDSNESTEISLPFEVVKEISNEREFFGSELAKKYAGG